MLYGLKQLALTPRTVLRRRRMQRTGTGPIPDMFEHFHFNNGVYAAFRRVLEEPGFLTHLPANADSVVLDVGGFDGNWCRRVVERHGCTVHTFEPSPSALERLRVTVAGLDGVTVHPFGLGARTRRASLAAKGPGSSLYDDSAGFDHDAVEVRDVIDVLDELGLDTVDVTKINIEGGEYELLERVLDADAATRLGVITVQFHEWLPRAHWRRARIRRRLRRTHAEQWNYPWVWELWSPR